MREWPGYGSLLAAFLGYSIPGETYGSAGDPTGESTLRIASLCGYSVRFDIALEKRKGDKVN